MTQRTLFVLLVMACILLPGCPGTGSALVGAWTFTFGSSDFGVTLSQDGEATSFLIDGILTGSLTWHTHDDQFVMDQIRTSGSRFIYTALISNDGQMLDGARVTWSGPGTGIGAAFSGAKM